MAKSRVFSRSNVVGNPYLWRPNLSNKNHLKEIPIGLVGTELTCDGINDFKTTYMTKRVWVAETGMWSAPLYVLCNYVE